MANLKTALLSLDARGTLSKAITFVKRRGQNIAEKTPAPKDAQAPEQLAWRHMFNKCVDLWHTLSAAEKEKWESAARQRHMTGYAWYISQCLRPNPGIYLPLQGGTMSGDIDMAKNRVLKLPIASDDQEPITLAYTKAYIFPYLHYQGARVYHNIDQSVPDNTLTALAFNSQRYDTDTIHDTVVLNSHLTCKTAGKYAITGHVYFDSGAVTWRVMIIRLNGVTDIARQIGWCGAAAGFYFSVATIYQLAVSDFVELVVYQNTGAAIDVKVFGNYSPEFTMQRIGV